MQTNPFSSALTKVLPNNAIEREKTIENQVAIIVDDLRDRKPIFILGEG